MEASHRAPRRPTIVRCAVRCVYANDIALEAAAGQDARRSVE